MLKQAITELALLTTMIHRLIEIPEESVLNPTVAVKHLKNKLNNYNIK